MTEPRSIRDSLAAKVAGAVHVASLMASPGHGFVPPQLSTVDTSSPTSIVQEFNPESVPPWHSPEGESPVEQAAEWEAVRLEKAADQRVETVSEPPAVMAPPPDFGGGDLGGPPVA